MKCVIVHPELGVFLGALMGKGVFSRGDTHEIAVSYVFLSEADAKQIVPQIFNDATPDHFAYFSLPKGYEDGDTISLLAAGVPMHLLEGMLAAEAAIVKKMRKRGRLLVH